MAKRVKNFFSEIAKKLERDVCTCPICRAPIKRSDFENTSYILYHERYLAEDEQTPLSVDFKTPSRADEPYSLILSGRKPRLNYPLHSGEVVTGKSKLTVENGKIIGYSIMRIGIRICGRCSEKYDPLTKLKAVKHYILERDGKTYPYLEEQIRKLEGIVS